MNSIESIIKTLQLDPHPEGGFFREVYRSGKLIRHTELGSSYSGSRNYCTSIYFLLTSESFSAFHRIIQDEIWHFYCGSPLLLHMITQQGIYSKVLLGNSFSEEQVPQFVVPGGTWFAAHVAADSGHSLVGCTVSPGFDFADFEVGKREILLQLYPQHGNLITRLTRE